MVVEKKTVRKLVKKPAVEKKKLAVAMTTEVEMNKSNVIQSQTPRKEIFFLFCFARRAFCGRAFWNKG
jgi:hypothetical protein